MVNPVVRRLRSLMGQTGIIITAHGTDRDRRMQRVLDIVFDEAMEEIAQADEMQVALLLNNIARIAQWAASGDISVLPPELLAFGCAEAGMTVAEYLAGIPDPDVVVDAEIVDDDYLLEARIELEAADGQH